MMPGSVIAGATIFFIVGTVFAVITKDDRQMAAAVAFDLVLSVIVGSSHWWAGATW